MLIFGFLYLKKKVFFMKVRGEHPLRGQRKLWAALQRTTCQHGSLLSEAACVRGLLGSPRDGSAGHRHLPGQDPHVSFWSGADMQEASKKQTIHS